MRHGPPAATTRSGRKRRGDGRGGDPRESTVTVRAGDRVFLGTMEVHAVYAKPPEGDPERGIAPPDVTHLGYVVDASGVRVYISGDPINTFAERDDLIRPVAELRPHIGFLTTHPTEGEFPFFEGSVLMATKIGLATAVPRALPMLCQAQLRSPGVGRPFRADRPERLIIPHNETVLYTPPQLKRDVAVEWAGSSDAPIVEALDPGRSPCGECKSVRARREGPWLV